MVTGICEMENVELHSSGRKINIYEPAFTFCSHKSEHVSLLWRWSATTSERKIMPLPLFLSSVLNHPPIAFLLYKLLAEINADITDISRDA